MVDNHEARLVEVKDLAQLIGHANLVCAVTGRERYVVAQRQYLLRI
jgi:hypothetical protein